MAFVQLRPKTSAKPLKSGGSPNRGRTRERKTCAGIPTQLDPRVREETSVIASFAKRRSFCISQLLPLTKIRRHFEFPQPNHPNDENGFSFYMAKYYMQKKTKNVSGFLQ